MFVEKIEGNKKKVKDLKKGDLTRIYQNPNKEILHDIFECFDNTNLFKRVNEKSNFWKEILRNLQNIRNLSEEEIYKTLVNAGLSITFDSYQNWVKKDSKIKFPKSIKDLAIILREANPQSIILLVKDYKILINEYNSRMVKSGAEFSNEVENYILTRKKGKMLEMLSNTDIDKIVDDNAPLRTIKSITLIEDDIYE